MLKIFKKIKYKIEEKILKCIQEKNVRRYSKRHN